MEEREKNGALFQMTEIGNNAFIGMKSSVDIFGYEYRVFLVSFSHNNLCSSLQQSIRHSLKKTKSIGSIVTEHRMKAMMKAIFIYCSSILVDFSAISNAHLRCRIWWSTSQIQQITLGICSEQLWLLGNESTVCMLVELSTIVHGLPLDINPYSWPAITIFGWKSVSLITIHATLSWTYEKWYSSSSSSSSSLLLLWSLSGREHRLRISVWNENDSWLNKKTCVTKFFECAALFLILFNKNKNNKKWFNQTQTWQAWHSSSTNHITSVLGLFAQAFASESISIFMRKWLANTEKWPEINISIFNFWVLCCPFLKWPYQIVCARSLVRVYFFLAFMANIRKQCEEPFEPRFYLSFVYDKSNEIR